MESRRWLVIALALAGGLMSAVQSRMNGELALHLGNGLEAALYSFGSGLVILALLVLARKPLRVGLHRVWIAIRDGELRWWHALGGLLGAFFVAVQSAVVPVMGVAVFLVTIVAGQSGNSLIVDRAGLGPAGKQPITGPRLVSAVLAIVAVAIAVSNRFTSGSISLIALLFALAAGAGIALQAAINGRVSRASGHPLSATSLNFALGTLGLVIAFLIRWGAGWGAPTSPFGAPWWAYFGGAVGIVFIVIAVWAVPIVGVLVYALTNIAGQLLGAVALDVVAPTPGTQLAWNLFAGAALAFGAAFIASRRRA